MEQSPDISCQTSDWGHDPLDDMKVSPAMERYFKVRAGLAFLLRSQASPARVFALYALPVSELEWFCLVRTHEAEAWVLAYISKIVIETPTLLEITKSRLLAAFFMPRSQIFWATG